MVEIMDIVNVMFRIKVAIRARVQARVRVKVGFGLRLGMWLRFALIAPKFYQFPNIGGSRGVERFMTLQTESASVKDIHTRANVREEW